jgi:molecular chaperone DnaK
MVYNIEKMLKDSRRQSGCGRQDRRGSGTGRRQEDARGLAVDSGPEIGERTADLASHKLAEAMYKGSTPQSGAGPADRRSSGRSGSRRSQKKDEGVIDAEYVDVDEKK